MADVNTCTRKRKLLSQNSEFEVLEEDEGVGGSQPSEFEFSEPDSKVMYLETQISQATDSNLENSAKNDVELDVKQKLLALQDEIQRLKAENEVLRMKSCSCPKPRVNDEEKSVMTIIFNDSVNFNLYKEKLVELLDPVPEFCVSVEENNLLICVTKDKDVAPNEWVVVDKELKLLKGSSKKKRKSKKIDKTEELFVLDTTPSLSIKRNLFYESKFSVLGKSTGAITKEAELKSANNATACFNCNESHNLRDCPQPKNYMKINAARQKFKNQQTTKALRYHLEDDQRFAHLQPGKISEKLQKALGLRHNQLPEHIYRMRQLGYPPGWLNEIQENSQSGLVLFDFEGKNTFDQKVKVPDLDPDKIIEYPGFNVPTEKGVKDEHRLYGCPSYSRQSSKENMLMFMQGVRKKAQDNLETCDMDIDNTTSDKEIELAKLSNHSKEQLSADSTEQVRSSNTSPTLGELESKKQKLLAELTENNSNSILSEELEETIENTDNTIDETYKTLDVTGDIDDLNETTENTNSNHCDTTTPSNNSLNIVRNSCFGTPILKSASPYDKLPNPDNFSQNVSQVINFENLPNSTGKYDQMVGVLEKVRKTLRSLSDPKS